MGEVHRTQCRDSGRTSHALAELRAPRISTRSPNQKLWDPILLGFYEGLITQARLIKSLGHRRLNSLQPLLPSLKVGRGVG